MYTPLAEKIRPKSLDDIIGQTHILGKNMPLRNLIESKHIVNMVFYGPPGTGKTSVAKIAAGNSSMNFKILNCTSLSTSEIKEALGERENTFFNTSVLLYLDEIQYLNKKQQQTLLEKMENGNVKIIASTTENPYFSIYNAILSRCAVFEFKPVPADDISPMLRKTLDSYEKELGEKIDCPDESLEILSQLTGGDVRKAVNTLEVCVLSLPKGSSSKIITKELVLKILGKPRLSYEKNGDSHYDLLSAFQKSMRGSDPDAAVYYLARLLEFGELQSICRRLMICACEDVGLAYPQVISIVKSAVDIALQVGLREARIPLSDAVILVCMLPKSNSAYNAINKALADIQNGKTFSVPRHLQNVHCDSSHEKGRTSAYVYPHDFLNHWVKQDYLPDELKGTSYYISGHNKMEQGLCSYWRKIKNEET